MLAPSRQDVLDSRWLPIKGSPSGQDDTPIGLLAVIQVELGDEVRERMADPHVYHQEVLLDVILGVAVAMVCLEWVLFSPSSLAQLTLTLAEVSHSARLCGQSSHLLQEIQQIGSPHLGEDEISPSQRGVFGFAVQDAEYRTDGRLVAAQQSVDCATLDERM